MHRRDFLAFLGVTSASLALEQAAHAALAETKIKRVRFYHAPQSRPLFNQSYHVVTVETDSGLMGIGEGGSRDTVEQCAGLIVGESPHRIAHLWQRMYRAYFYPPGREKLHALGALDLALWDLKGKVVDVPVYELLGGLARKHIECYATGFPEKSTIGDTAKACLAAGFRAFRFHGSDPRQPGGPFHARRAVRDTIAICREIRTALGPDGDWAIDLHTRYDMADAVRLCNQLEELEPYFVEDLIRSENPGVYQQLRPRVQVPIAVGEHFGDRWELNELVEDRLIDYSRVTLPNCGGITEFMKIAALCETHYVGLIPHFTGPIATASLVHACACFSGPVMMEMTGDGQRPQPHLRRHFRFEEGKLWPRPEPGLGVEIDTGKLKLIAEITEPYQPVQLLRRDDGSITNW